MIVIGHTDCPRVAHIQAALASLGHVSTHVITWTQLLSDFDRFANQLSGDVRLESPGRNFDVERLLIEQGGGEPPPAFDRGRLWNLGAWSNGFHSLLQRLQHIPNVRWFAHPAEAITLFDKRLSHSLFAQHDIPIAESLENIKSFDELQQRMPPHGRAFVKLAWGSAATGVVAYAVGPLGQRAVTTVEMVAIDGERRFYNSRKLRTYESLDDVRTLFDWLIPHGVHVEEWVPKAGFQDHTFDLRIVTIGGEPCHTVVRMSQSPITNLYLLNRRSDVAPLREIVPVSSWDAMLDTARRVAALFPRCHALGLDIAFTPNYRRHFVIEANAFGDLLPGTLHNGEDTYTAELRTWMPT